MRAHNERLVLTLVRRHGALAKVDIARMTGLSAQTVSVIMRALEADGLLTRGDPVRGKVGQPSVPMRLAADGAFSCGLKIGRRSAEMVLIDFLGAVRGRAGVTYARPSPDGTARFARDAFGRLMTDLAPPERRRVCGIGVAMPFLLWDWVDPAEDPSGEMAAWRDHDIGADLAAATGLPVLVENDGSAACAAELMFGTGRLPNGFAYFYVGHFVGGAVVLGGQVFTGRTGNAGAFGSMPVGLANGATRQLIDVASLRGLESALLTVGAPSSQLWTSPETWTVDAGVLSGWLDRAAAGIAQATAAAACILDMDLAIIDGWFPAEVRADLVARTGAALARIDMAGATRPAVSAGSIGPAARSLGAASLPISARYLIEPSMRMA